MIDVKIICRIIDENRSTCLDTQEHRKHAEDVAKGLQWSDSRIKLRDYIVSLQNEDIYDILALVSYGEDRYRLKDMSANKEEFYMKRNSVALCINNDEDKQHIAIYLLKKGIHLSDYLQYSLPLFENVNIEF